MRFQVAEKFRIRTSKGEIELTPGQVIALPEEKAKDLLKAGRVVLMISGDLTKTFQEHFEKTVDETAAEYIPGTLEMVREDFSNLANEIDQAEDEINELWLLAREGTGTLKNFEEAVDRWRTLHLRAIRFYTLTENVEKVN